MLKKRNLLFLSLLILGILLLSSCFLNPPATEGILKGQIMVPEGTTQTKDLTGEALPDATVNIIDLTTGAIIATTTTDSDGHYQVAVPPGGPYLLEAVKGSVKLEQITCPVEVGIEYDLGTADCTTTAVALIVQAMLDAGADLADFNLADIEADPDFDEVVSSVTSIIEAGQDPTESAAIEQAVEDFLSPPAPTPTPTPTPTYTVTFDSQGGSAVISQTVEEGGKVTEPTAPTKLGYTFGSWYKESACTNVWDFDTDTVTANVTLYAKWTINTYTVTYDGNGSTGGTVPVDPSSPYDYGATVTVLGNTGTLVKTGYTFAGWNTQADGNGTDRAVGSTFILGATNETLYAKWTSQTTYSLRDVGPAGGLIFYINPNYVTDGWRYLEAAPSDQIDNTQWGCDGTTIPGADGIVVGTGKQNTIDIEAGCATVGTAADICANLSLGGYNDWFLPSKDELNLMYTNLRLELVGDFNYTIYWSSSEASANTAWYQHFIDGGTLSYDKDYGYGNVRAARAF